MRPLTPSRLINGEVIVPGICNSISFALSVVAPVFAKVNLKLKQAGLAGIQTRLHSREGGFEAGGAVGNPYVV